MQKRSFGKLRVKFIVRTLIPVLCVLFIAALVCYNMISKNKRNEIKQEIHTEVTLNNDIVFDTLEKECELLDLKGDYDAMYDYATNTHSDQKLYYHTKAIKQLTEYVDVEKIKSSWIALFKEKSIQSDEFNAYGIYNEHYFTRYAWYNEAALNSGDMYFTGIYTSEFADNDKRINKVMAVVQPILDKETNELIGAYGVEISMIYLNSLIDIDKFNNSHVLILDNNNELLFFDSARDLDTYSRLNEEIDELLNARSKYVDFRGEKYFPVSCEMPENNWNLLYLISREEVLSDTLAVALPLAVIFIIAAMVLSIIMITFVNKTVKSINLVTSRTRGIADGNLNNKISIDSDDEFGELAYEFNNTVKHLKRKAEHDEITGLYNTQTFYAKADELISDNDETTGRYAIVRLDIDHFRLINDMYSWQVGNNALIHISDCIKRYISEDSICARDSVDVFLICMKYVDKCDLEDALNNIKNDILEFDISVDINPHFGVYLNVEKGVPVYIMCDKAAVALSLIKGNLLVSISYYDNIVSQKNMDIKFIETHMQQAIDDRQFVIMLQPKYDMETGSIVGAESLVRWIHPEKGIIRPDSFIPIFEKNGFIIKLDEYVWEETCKHLRRWLDMGYSPKPVSVNVSRIHIYDKRFVDKLCSLIKKYDLPTELLELEFTESALLDDIQELYSLMKQLKDRNFVLLMDDFASGYSSLNTLKSAPFDVVKIDKEFIDAICESDKDRGLVASTIAMINSQNMDIVVEGVEKVGQVKILRDAGCKIAQGYFYSKPVSIEEFEKMAFEI